MSPISSPNIVNGAILEQIRKMQSTQSQTTSSLSTAPATSSDQVNFSSFSNILKQLKALQQSNPAELTQVLTDDATKLKAAAAQISDPQQAAFLNNLAARFQTAASSGDLSVLRPDSGHVPNSSSAVPGYHHRHHSGSNLASRIIGPSPSQSDASPGNEAQQLLSGLVNG